MCRMRFLDAPTPDQLQPNMTELRAYTLVHRQFELQHSDDSSRITERAQ
jgi:hypothetical protein